MKPEEIIEKVCRSFEILLGAAAEYDGLFPSIIDLKRQRMSTNVPEAIPGQRQGDRSHPGSNLIHDEAALRMIRAGDAGVPGADLPRCAEGRQ